MRAPCHEALTPGSSVRGVDELPSGTAAVTVERDGPVTTVTLSRPHARNAVDGPTAAALADAFRAFDADPAASVAVLTGAGGTFCAGADLRAVGTATGNRTEEDGDGPMGPSRLRLTKPVIAAVDGHAVAGGLELALWCDLRVAAETAVFGVFCRRWGVPLIDGGTVRLPRLVGAGRAMDLVLTGRAVEAVEALAIGLVDRVVPAGGARAAAQELARQLAAFPQTCLREDRASLLEQEGLDEAAALANEFRHGRTSLAVDALPGAARFAAGAGRHGEGV
jgi:enoyl-CoA hydratase